jgi:hypothetical protein
MAERSDQSHLDLQYFIDPDVYNCPYCNRRHVRYNISTSFSFDWTSDRRCYGFIVECHSCGKQSMHLAYSFIADRALVTDRHHSTQNRPRFNLTNIDDHIFYSVPTSFFVMDNRIPKVIRELITEAEGSRKMNFLTGASACARKAVYEFLVKEDAEGDTYEDKIKSLKKRFTNVDPELFDVLAHIQDMTSDKVHEQSWPKWDSSNLTLIIEALKAVLHEVYVVPQEKAGRSSKIRNLLEQVRGKPEAPDSSQ